MRSILLMILCGATLWFPSEKAGAAPPGPGPADPLGERFFPPDLILHYSEAIGLSDEKRAQIVARMEKVQARFQELEQSLVKERDALVALLDREKPDDAAVAKQLDKYLAREQELRREQLNLMLSLRNQLSAQQQTRLKELIKTQAPSALENRLKDKVALVEAGMQKQAAGGGDPAAIAAKMQQFPELMQAGKVQEAEALLDRVLRELEIK